MLRDENTSDNLQLDYGRKRSITDDIIIQNFDNKRMRNEGSTSILDDEEEDEIDDLDMDLVKRKQNLDMEQNLKVEQLFGDEYMEQKPTYQITNMDTFTEKNNLQQANLPRE